MGSTSAQTPQILTQQLSQSVAVGGNASLTVLASGAAPLSYQWFKDGRWLLGATNSTLTLANAGLTNSGTYYVVVTNGSGMAISRPASVAVGNPSLLAWGDNQYGQLGNGTTTNVYLPITVASNVVAGAGGDNHSLFVTIDGTLWAMGNNSNGQLGNGTTNDVHTPVSVATNVVAVAAGYKYSLFVTGDGRLWAMGYNSVGNLGNGTTNDASVPVNVASNVVAVAAGTESSQFVKADGTLWEMGYNGSGELGNGTTIDAHVPVSVASNVVAVAKGFYFSLFVKGDGTMWGMGGNEYGDLGGSIPATNPGTNQPVSLASNVVAVAAGYFHTLFVKNDGTLWAMGDNADGELGNGGSANENPTAVSVASNVVVAAAGAYHSLFEKNDGTLWAMGYNSYGQLGNGTTTNAYLPIAVTPVSVANIFPSDRAFCSLASGLNYSATVILTNLNQVYTGSGINATALTIPPGLRVDLTYNGSTQAPTNAGSYTVVGTINDKFYSGSATGTLNISQAVPIITWATPSAIVYGTALSSNQLNAIANVPGSFAYAPTNGAVLPAGTYNLTAQFTPADTTDYTTASAMVSLLVNQSTTNSQLEIFVNGDYSPSNIFFIPASKTIQVTMQTSFTNGYIFYTLDGAIPTPGDPDTIEYLSNGIANPFIITNTTVVTATAYSSDGSTAGYASPVSIIVIPVYVFTDSTPGGGGVVFNPPGGIYLSNTVVTVTAVASNGWTFMNWQGITVVSNNPVTVTVNSSANIASVFGTGITTSTNAPDNGVALWPTNRLYAYGSTVQLVAVPGVTYRFNRWFNNLFGPTNDPLAFTVLTANTNINAYFATLAATNFTLTTLLNGYGTVALSPSQTSYASNTVVQVTAVPDSGYVFTGWSGNASGTNNPISLTMRSNLTVTAGFGLYVPASPFIAITSPTNGALYTTPANVVFTGSATDPNSNGTIVQIVLIAGTNVLAITTNADFNLNWTNAVIGTNTLTAVATDNEGLSTTSTVSIVVQLPDNPAMFQFGATNYSVNESDGSVTLTVTNAGNLGGTVNFITEDGTAHGGSGFSGDYTSTTGSLVFTDYQSIASIVIPILDNSLDQPDIEFQVQLQSSGPTNLLGMPSSTTVTIHENDIGGATNSLLTHPNPSAQPATSASLSVSILPVVAGGQWRFPWEYGWHNSGDSEANLQQGNYPVEFSTPSNFLSYPPTVSVAVTNNGPTLFTNQYLPTIASNLGETGSLTVNISPTAPPGSGWRIYGESSWRSNNSTASGLLPGNYAVEFEPVSEYSRPASVEIPVNGVQVVYNASYMYATPLPNNVATPTLVSGVYLTKDYYQQYPYCFNGQLQTDVGYGSGVVVRPSVVLTAAHLVFNDNTLAFVTNAWWWFQEEAGTFQPQPLAARGWVVLSGYAAQRTNDLSGTNYGIGSSSPQSREDDVAALYFTSQAARGGYGGYLCSDTVPNPYLTGSNLKMLVGYPVDGSEYGLLLSNNDLYATSPQIAPLTQATNDTYTADWFLSFPGNSGGPLYVLYNNYYYPTAVYLGTIVSGGTNFSVVRAINSDVVNLINIAASEGDDGTNYNGGPPFRVIAPPGVVENQAYLQLVLGPPAAVAAGAGWALAGDGVYGTATNYTREVTTTNTQVVFAPVTGWNPPSGTNISVQPGVLTVANLEYTVVAPVMQANVGGLSITGTSNTSYVIQYRTNLTSGTWQPLHTNTLGPGINYVLPWPPTNGAAGFYRAVWLGQ